MVGSEQYVDDREDLQGGSDEPRWLGVIQHDQILFDHGPGGSNRQSPNADIDIEYQSDSRFSSASRDLARRFQQGARKFATEYPAMVSSNMRNTDSVSFEEEVASISVRDNTRDEIGDGSNPHWHASSDVMSTYRNEDFRFGFNIVKMTVGTIWEIVDGR